MMRSFLSRGSRADRAGAPASSVPAIPQVLKAKVNQRLEQLADEHEKITTEDSDQSENSLLQDEHLPLYASSSSSDEDDGNDNARNRGAITAKCRPFVSNKKVADESARLLRTIASDLSETGTAYFEEDASETSHPRRGFYQSSLDDPSPSSILVTMDHSQKTGIEDPNATNRWAVQPRVKVDETTATPSLTLAITSLDPPLRLEIMVGTVVSILILCFTWQLISFPMNWMVWLSTGISTYCATCLWPAKRNTVVDEADLRWRSQELLAEGLPLKSRLLVAQTKARVLQRRIKLLKELQQVNQEFLARVKEEALALTVQVLLKSNRSPASTHLNALTLSVLPTKLATIDVKMQMPPVWALAQSKRGPRYILLNLFRELLSDKSSMFQYPTLKIKPRNPSTASSKNKQTRSSSAKARAPKLNKPQRLDEI
eukprot:scaffold5833_cov165-Amphora_coffeaeformis.AAC.6